MTYSSELPGRLDTWAMTRLLGLGSPPAAVDAENTARATTLAESTARALRGISPDSPAVRWEPETSSLWVTTTVRWFDARAPPVLPRGNVDWSALGGGQQHASLRPVAEARAASVRTYLR